MVFIDKRNASGAEKIEGGTGADSLLGGRFDDSLYGGDGNDTARGGDGNDFMVDWGGNYNPLFGEHYEGGDDRFFGEGGNDTLRGADGDDSLDGGDDDDSIAGEGGDDTLIGGNGNDILDEAFTVYSGGGDDKLDGGAGFDTLRGGKGDDTLDGGADADVLNGGEGADLMFGGSGADTINGGDLDANVFDAVVQAGFLTRAQADAAIAAANAGDTVAYKPLGGAVDVDLERAVQSGGDAEGDRLTGVENLRGTLRADVLRGDDKANVLEGSAGSDVLEGRGGADTLNGGAGGLSGDPGLDTASYASSDAAVNIDLIRATQQGGDAQGDTLISIENVTGSRFGDQLRGDDLDNTFDAGFGNDVIDGRGGSDTIDLKAWDVGLGLSARSVAVTLSDLGDGTARRTDFFQLAETDTLRGIENVLGTNVKDTITGNGADNRLEGRAGNDVLSGGGGADTIVGGTGNDDMTGGTGADVFDFNAFDEMSLASGSTFDIIRDFQSGVDKIDLRDLGDLTAVGSLQGIAGQVQFVTGSLNGVNTPALLIDRNGDNVADHVVFVQTNGGPFPLNSDLLII